MDCSITALALGMFDGVHIGHRALLNKTAELADLSGGDPAVFTFSNHPAEAFGKKQILLTSTRERDDLLRAEGMRYVITVPFTKEFAAKTPENFLEYLIALLHPRYLICGFNYTFGAGGQGDPSLLEHESDALGYSVCEVPPVLYGGSPVSSSRIRTCVESGRMEDASVMLGRDYSLTGTLIGKGRFCPDEYRAFPKEGTYRVLICSADGRNLSGKIRFENGAGWIDEVCLPEGAVRLRFLQEGQEHL